MRVAAAFNRVLALPGTTVRDVSFEPARITVTVALRRRRLVCADCSYSSRARYDPRTVDSSWRHLDLGRLRLVIRAKLRRVDCPTHGVRTEGVPFARVESGFTRDFEDLVAWLATRMDKSAVRRLVRVAWQTVGAICARVVADELDPGRLDELFEVGIDEVSWRKQHRYLTLVTDHRTGKVVWGAQGKDTAPCDQFFAELGEHRSAQLAAVSTDMGAAYLKVGRQAGPRAPSHRVHRPIPRRRAGHRPPAGLEPTARRRPRQGQAVQGGTLGAAPSDPSDCLPSRPPRCASCAATAARHGAPTSSRRACARSSPVTSPPARRPSCWTAGASRPAAAAWKRSSSSPPRSASTAMASSPPSGLGATTPGLRRSTTKVRLITRRAYGFHSAQAALALMMLACGPITLRLPHEQTHVRPHSA